MKSKTVIILLTLALLTACGTPAASPIATAIVVEPTVTLIPLPQAFADLVSVHPEFKIECNADLCDARYVPADNVPEVTISKAAQTDNQWKYSIIVNGQEITYDGRLDVATNQDKVSAVVVTDKASSQYYLDIENQMTNWQPLTNGTRVTPTGVERWNAETNQFEAMDLPYGAIADGLGLNAEGNMLVNVADETQFELVDGVWRIPAVESWEMSVGINQNDPKIKDILDGKVGASVWTEQKVQKMVLVVCQV
jgi:hypothetical protein